jgi:hypothetical protein
MRLIVMGAMGRIPFAGMAWEALHYVEGFRRLGHDVCYVEDTRDWPYDPERNAVTKDCTYTVNFISRMMSWYGLPDRWAYRSAARHGRVYGMPASQFSRLFKEADVLVNVTASTILYDEHLEVPVRVYLQTDPGQAEIEIDKGCADTIQMVKAHTHFFNFAENLGQDTGFGRALPTGEGLFPFNTMDEIVAAFEAIQSDYPKHCHAARAIAEEYFRAETVLGKLMDDLGI